MRSRLLYPLFLVLILPASATVARASWLPDGNYVAGAASQPYSSAIISDGQGGVVIAWQNDKSFASAIYVQRINGAGVAQWPGNGIRVCGFASRQVLPALSPDGTGGAIVVWQDARDTTWNLYAQRINGAGVAQWTADGVPIVTAALDQVIPLIASDGGGGAYIAWSDNRSTILEVYAQRINSSGTALWAADGMLVCAAANSQHDPALIVASSSRAIVAWVDERNNNNDIYIQRFSSAGAAQWTADGVALSTVGNQKMEPKVVLDRTGGAVVTWMEHRGTPGSWDIMARRIDGTGTPQWSSHAVAISAFAFDQNDPVITTDGNGGAIIAWWDARDFATHDDDIYAQRISDTGLVQWADDGVSICNLGNRQLQPALVSDGVGGAIMSWYDRRLGANGNGDIYAQRINATGAVQWTANGIPVCAAADIQDTPVMLPDGGNGAFIAWNDNRTGVASLYVQRIGSLGMIPTGVGATPSAPATALSDAFPDPFSAETSMHLTLQHDSNVSVDVFDVAGRRVRRIEVGHRAAGTTTLRFDGRDDHASALPSGVYFFRVHAGTENVTRKMVIAR